MQFLERCNPLKHRFNSKMLSLPEGGIRGIYTYRAIAVGMSWHTN